jgi:hypothetical protein
VDTFQENLMPTAEGVKTDGLGRDYYVIHMFSESLHGALKWVSPYGAAVNNTTLKNSLIQTELQEFPGWEDTTLTGYVQRKLQLVEALGNMFVPLDYVRIDALQANHGKLCADLLKGMAKLINLARIHSFYSGGIKSQIGVIGGSSGSGTAAVTIFVKGGAVSNFQNGMHVDVYDTTGVTKRNLTTQVVVDGVLSIPLSTHSGGYGAVTLRTKDGSNLTVTTGDLIVQWESINVGPSGPNYWLVNSGTIYNIAFADHQQFQSIVLTGLGAVTETKIYKMLARSWIAHGEDMVDSLLTSIGVTLATIDTSYGLASRFNRQLGDRNLLSMGFKKPGTGAIQFGDRQVAWYMSRYMPSDSDFTASQPAGGIIWGLKTRDNNLKRYVAPGITGSAKDSKYGRNVDFPFAQGGPNGIFRAARGPTGRSVKLLEAPMSMMEEVAPDFLPGIKATGANELM